MGPFIWMQERETEADAACGCRLVYDGGLPAFYQCPTHAAAPDLLAALKRVMGDHGEGGIVLDSVCIKAARAAIEKAGGRA